MASPPHTPACSAASLWLRFHRCQSQAFQQLYGEEVGQSWRVSQYIQEAMIRAPVLARETIVTTVECLKEAIDMRRQIITTTARGAQQATPQHDELIGSLGQITHVLMHHVNPDLHSDLPSTLEEWTRTEAEPESSDMSVDDMLRYCFFESIRDAIDQMHFLWLNRLDVDDAHSRTTAAAVIVWCFHALETAVGKAVSICGAWFDKVESRWWGNDAFGRDYQHAKDTFIDLTAGKLEGDAYYLNQVMLRALTATKGSIPIVHTAMLTIDQAVRTPKGHAKRLFVFMGSVEVLVLLRLRERSGTAVMSHPPNALSAECLRVSDRAASHSLLHRRLGEPTTVSLLHLYVHQRLRKQIDPLPRMERLVTKFQGLIFWDGLPASTEECWQSMREWVLDLPHRSLQSPSLFQTLFDRRLTGISQPSLVVKLMRQEAIVERPEGLGCQLAQLLLDVYHHCLLDMLLVAVDRVLAPHWPPSVGGLALTMRVAAAIRGGLRDVDVLERVLHIWSQLVAEDDDIVLLERRVS